MHLPPYLTPRSHDRAGPFPTTPTCLAPPGDCSCILWVYAILDEGAGKPELGAGGWAWTTDWRCSGGRLPLPLPLLTSPPPPACITRTHPPSHTSIHNLTPSSSLYTNFPLLLREERDRQSPVRPAFWGEGPHPPRLVVVDLVDGYTLSLRTRIYPWKCTQYTPLMKGRCAVVRSG